MARGNLRSVLPVSPGRSDAALPPQKVLPSFLVQELLDAFVMRSLVDLRHPWHKVILLSSANVAVKSDDPVLDLVHRVVLFL